MYTYLLFDTFEQQTKSTISGLRDDVTCFHPQARSLSKRPRTVPWRVQELECLGRVAIPGALVDGHLIANFSTCNICIEHK